MERTQGNGQADRLELQDQEKTSNKSDTSFEPGQNAHVAPSQRPESEPIIEHTIEALLASTESDGRGRRDTANFGEEREGEEK